MFARRRATQGIEISISVRRKDGCSRFGTHSIVRQQSALLEAQIDEDHWPVTEFAEVVEPVGAFDQLGRHVDGRDAHHRRNRHFLAIDPYRRDMIAVDGPKSPEGGREDACYFV